ncbi:hypothetical protein C8R46DRAFT_1119918 [Mycena filopes]|nr:hypothetical protein C8R46DRAFT_1119918 [Mycena filopes]
MCPCFLQGFFGHSCTGHPGYDPDLDVIFPLAESHYTVTNYLEHFFYSIPHARTVTNVSLRSVQYCHTRGRSGYPFLLMRLQHHHLYGRPIMLKLQGHDGAPRSTEDSGNIFGSTGTWLDVTDTADDNSLVVVGGLHQRVKQLVGAPKGYDVCYTMKGVWCEFADFLAVMELAAELAPTRARFPAVVFAALEDLFKGRVRTSRRYRTPRDHPSPVDIAGDTKAGVVDAFTFRSGRMKEKIRACRGSLTW